MAARTLGLRPLQAFGRLLAPGVPVRQACRGSVTMRVMTPGGPDSGRRAGA